MSPPRAPWPSAADLRRLRELWPTVALAPLPVLVLVALVGLVRPRAERAVAGAGALNERVVARGVVVPTEGTAEVRALASGRVVRVHVREGERVAAGQLLAELDEAAPSAELERRALDADAQALERQALEDEARAARAEWEAAKQRAERDGAGAEARQVELAAKARLNAAEARARAARRPAGARHRAAASSSASASASAEAGRHAPDRARLVSPIAGVVLVRRADPGDTVREETAQALFEIADPSRLEVRVEVDEAFASKVAEAQAVTVTLPGGREPVGRGRLGRVGARLERRAIDADDARVRADGLVRTAWVEWEGDPLALPIGQRLEVHVGLPARSVAAVVPRRAVRVRDGRAVVTVPFGWWTTERAVELGAADEVSVEVRGLAEGTPVLLTEN